MAHNFATNIKYLDFMILNYLDDTSLCQVFKTNRYWAQKGQNNEYFQFRTQMYHGQKVVANKPSSVTFKQQYLILLKHSMEVVYQR